MTRRFARRELLLGSLWAVGAACGSNTSEARPASGRGRTSAPSSITTTSSTAPRSTSRVASGTGTGDPLQMPVDRAVLRERYGSVVPTTWSIDLPGVARRVADRSPSTVALTFDACGGPHADGVDGALIDLLRREQVPATLFLNARWVEANQPLAHELAADPLFEIGNHGTRHVPLSVTGRSAYGIDGTRSVDEVVDEVWTNHVLLNELTGQPPRWFRSGTAHYDEVATAIVSDLGELPVGFAVNGDAGATFSAAQVRREVTAPATAGGAVVIMHMIRPSGGTAEGLTAALPVLRARGARFVTLSGGGGATTG